MLDISSLHCPVCYTGVKYHCRYEKYFYTELIPIIRVRCKSDNCKKTHALIPSFSVPCCSTGTQELDQFIVQRSQGKTVDKSGQCFVDKGMGDEYPEEIHKRLKNRSLNNIMLVFRSLENFIKNLSRDYAVMITSLARHLVSSASATPATTLNIVCHEYRCNPVLFSRFNILLFPENITKTKISLNTPCRVPP